MLKHLTARAEKRSVGIDSAAQIKQVQLVAARAVQKQQRPPRASTTGRLDEAINEIEGGRRSHRRGEVSNGRSPASISGRCVSRNGGKERCSPSCSAFSSAV